MLVPPEEPQEAGSMKIFTVQTESYGSIMERGKNGIVIGSNYEPVTVLEELEEVPSLEGTLLVFAEGLWFKLAVRRHELSAEVHSRLFDSRSRSGKSALNNVHQELPEQESSHPSTDPCSC